MKFFFLILLQSVYVCYGITFNFQNNTASIDYNSQIYDNPFTGGINYARISWFDWDQDGDIDLFLLDEDLHFKYFENIGDQYNHNFILVDHPINDINGIGWFYLSDMNDNGNIDLITQSSFNPSHVMFFEFNGNEFEYISLLYKSDDSPLNNTSVMTPTFADIDDDGDLDFFSGNINGTVNFFNNIGLNNNLPVFEFSTSYWQDIIITGPSLEQRHGASAIKFIDLDGDQDLDLAWGDYFQRSLYIIWNIGTPQIPIMDSENFFYQYPPNDPVYTSGQNMPSFTDIDGDGDMDLFVTILGGDGPIQLNDNFIMYENIGTSNNPIYEHSTNNFLGALDLFSDVVPTFVDIDNDGFSDFFAGQDYTTESFPTQGRLFYFENNTSEDLVYTLQDSAYLGLEVGLSIAPEFIDIDNDNDYDLFIGEYNGKIKYYRNDGSSTSPNFIDVGYLSDIDLGFFSVPEFCDIDNDDDYDLFIGNYNGQIYFYENIGDRYNFEFVESLFQISIDPDIKRSAPEFIDFDNDGDFDLLLGTEENGLIIYWNIGTPNNPIYIEDSCLEIPYMGSNIKPSIINSQNFLDIELVTGVSTGGFMYYSMTPYTDLNFDYSIDIVDITIIVNKILASQESDILCLADTSHDGNLDIFDILIMIKNLINF